MRRLVGSFVWSVGAVMSVGGCAAHSEAHSTVEPGLRARAELEAVRRATTRYLDPAEARADGYAPTRFALDLPLMGEHWVNRELLDRPVDLLRPAVLQYVELGGYRALVGVAYARRMAEGEPLPEGFAGDADVWHEHDFTALGEGRIAMLHAWLWAPSPDGVFAERNPALPYIRAGLPPEWAQPDGEASARGVALLVPGACRRLGALAGRRAGAERGARLRDACDDGALRVSMALAEGVWADELNAVAAEAWTAFISAR